jgi:Glycosyltransferase family 87
MDLTEPVRAAPVDAGWGLAAKRAGTHSLAIWSTLSVAWLFVIGLRRDVLAYDFHNAYLPAAHAVLAGHSPFPPATPAALGPGTAFVYPPLTGFLAAPLMLVPVREADAIMFAVAILCIVATLALLNVRDWRCYAVAFLWAPTYSSLQTANVILLVALGVAAVWRYRDRALVVGTIAGSVIALKLFAWPMLIWFVATRRFRAAAICAASAIALIFIPWAAIGFAGLSRYPHLLHMLSDVQWRDSYTPAALLSAALPHTAAIGLGYAFGLLVLARCVVVSRTGERRGIALAVAAMILLSPVVHLDYFVLLAVPLPLFRPRMQTVWLLPVLLWAAAQSGNGGDWQTAATLAIACATCGSALWPGWGSGGRLVPDTA